MEAFKVSVALLPYGCLLVKADDPAEQLTEWLLDAICGFAVFPCSNALLVTRRSGSLVASSGVISADRFNACNDQLIARLHFVCVDSFQKKVFLQLAGNHRGSEFPSFEYGFTSSQTKVTLIDGERDCRESLDLCKS